MALPSPNGSLTRMNFLKFMLEPSHFPHSNLPMVPHLPWQVLVPHLPWQVPISLHSRWSSSCPHFSLTHTLHIWLQPNKEFFSVPLPVLLLSSPYLPSKTLLSVQAQLKHLLLYKAFLGRAHITPCTTTVL